MKLLSFLWVKLARLFGAYRDQKHLWVSDIEDIRFENECHMSLNKELLTKHCQVFNLIPNNKHEGDGWWERVKVVHQVGFDLHYLRDIFPILDLGDVTPYYSTYLPREVLNDISKAPGHVIGFRPHITQPGVSHTVVWIHY